MWPEIIKKYESQDIWNVDETALYFRAIPDGTITFKNDLEKGGKRCKERVTAMFACSMTGEKKMALVTGKSACPHCFRGVKLLVDYDSRKSAWMKEKIYAAWLQNWEQELCHNNTHIMLLVDNCSVHSEDAGEGLTNISVAFLPPNTSVMQPLD